MIHLAINTKALVGARHYYYALKQNDPIEFFATSVYFHDYLEARSALTWKNNRVAKNQRGIKGLRKIEDIIMAAKYFYRLHKYSLKLQKLPF